MVRLAVRLAKVFVVLTAFWHIYVTGWIGWLIHGALLASPFVAGRDPAVRFIVGFLMLPGILFLSFIVSEDFATGVGAIGVDDFFLLTFIVGLLAYVVGYALLIRGSPGDDSSRTPVT